MPLEFITLVKGYHPPTTEDRGFLINLTRTRWNNTATTEAMNLLRAFAEPYFKMKCPESEESPPEVEHGSESQSTEHTSHNASKGSPKKSFQIQFSVREMVNSDMYCFLACNLADPEDFVNYIFYKLAEKNEFPRPKLPFRIIPVQRVCEATPREIEQTLLALLEQLMGNSYPYRFSLIDRSYSGGNGISHTEIINLARNCMWATNPNCVQCLKYQDYALVMDIIEPLFFIGVVRDFQRLASFNTSIIQKGVCKKDTDPDSEDDISDDPTLSEEEEKQRKLRIKRKRRADLLNLSQQESEAKKSLQAAESKAGEAAGDYGNGDNNLADEEEDEKKCEDADDD